MSRPFVPREPGCNVDSVEKRAFRFSCAIVPLCEALIKQGGVAGTVGKQLFDAATSVGANLAEATAAQSKPDFIAKVSIALKESREAHYWLRLTAEALPEAHPAADGLAGEASQFIAILTAILIKARSSDSRGPTTGKSDG